MKHVFIISSLVTVVCILPANANRTLTDTYVMTGKCHGLMAFGSDVSPECDKRVINNIFSDGRIDFTFSQMHNKKAVIYAFSGNSSQQVKMSENEISQPIDAVLDTIDGYTTVEKASGSCNYGQDNDQTIMVMCRAETGMGKFMGIFKSNSDAPKKLHY